jgi:hypothetical protein
MKILLINIDGFEKNKKNKGLVGWKNLALEKIRFYFESRGYQVEDYTADMPYEPKKYRSIWISCVFDWNKDRILRFKNRKTRIGGSGIDLVKILPFKIERMKPKINFGFTTRGCIRKCSFCVVPKKEGKIRVVGDIYDFWDGKAEKIVLLDNNFLAAPKSHFNLITTQIKNNRLVVDFNQGLDHRLLTDENYKVLKGLKRYGLYRFAFDDIRYEKTVVQAIKLMKRHNTNVSFWYVLVGFNSTFEEDLYRVNFLRDRNQRAFIQRYKKDRILGALSRWVNQYHIFTKFTWKDFLLDPRNPDWYREVFKEYIK